VIAVASEDVDLAAAAAAAADLALTRSQFCLVTAGLCSRTKSVNGFAGRSVTVTLGPSHSASVSNLRRQGTHSADAGRRSTSASVGRMFSTSSASCSCSSLAHINKITLHRAQLMLRLFTNIVSWHITSHPGHWPKLVLCAPLRTLITPAHKNPVPLISTGSLLD